MRGRGAAGGRSAAASLPAAAIPPLSFPSPPAPAPNPPFYFSSVRRRRYYPPHMSSPAIRPPPPASPSPPIAPPPSHLLHMLLHPVQVAVAAVAPDVGLFGDEDAGDEVERHGAGRGGKRSPLPLGADVGGDSAGRPPSLASLWAGFTRACGGPVGGRARGERRLCHQKEGAGGRRALARPGFGSWRLPAPAAPQRQKLKAGPHAAPVGRGRRLQSHRQF